MTASKEETAMWSVDASISLDLTNAAVSQLMQMIPWVFKWIAPGTFETSGHYESSSTSKIELKQGYDMQIPPCAKRGLKALGRG